jgi:hypothetical protein
MAPLALALAALLAASAGCVPGVKNPAQSDLASSGPAMDLAVRHRGREAAIGSLAARGAITWTDGQDRFFRFELIRRPPGTLLLTILDPMGRPAVRMASDGLVFTGLDYRSAQAFAGNADPARLSQVLPFDLGIDSERLLALLVGALPVTPVQAAAAPGPDGRPARILVVSPGPSGTQSLTADVGYDTAGRSCLTRIAVAAAAGNPAFEVRYGGFRDEPVMGPDGRESNGGPFPHVIDLLLDRGRRLSVRYDEVRLGVPIPESTFRLEIPSGFSLSGI